MLERLQRALHDHLLPRRHTALLLALVFAFAARPVIGHHGLAVAAFNISMLIILVIALYNVQVEDLLGERHVLLARRKRMTRLAWVLAVPAALERTAGMLVPSRRLLLMGSISWLIFFSFVTVTQVKSLLRHKRITGETLSLAVSVYLLLAITWGILFIVIYEFQPQAFNLGAALAGASALPTSEAFPVLFYFSLTTIATVGYGDILPLTLQARYAAVAEAIVGQFYLAILVARLVGLQLSGVAGESERK